MAQAIINTVKSKIYGHGRGWCFTPNAFSDLNNDKAVLMALSRLQAAGMIRRLSQGLYEYPRVHDILGPLPPKPESVAKALSEKNNTMILPSGAYAANLIGLSEQVPGKIVFLTNGRSRKIKIGNQEIVFRNVRESTLHAAGSKVGLVIQALKNIGKQNITKVVRKRVLVFLQGTPENEIYKNLKHAPLWVREIVKALLDEKLS